MAFNQEIVLSEMLTSLEEDVKKIKSTQPTTGDSSRLYRQIFNPGIFYYEWGGISQKLWRIECIPKINEAVGIFMIVAQTDPSVMYPMPGYFPVTSTDRIIYFEQYGVYSGTTEEIASISEPHIVTIYSNVDFDIRTELIATY